jgi:Fe-S-cluster containining protein
MFPCTQCGECCRRVDASDQTRRLDRGDGVCRHFDEATKACGIYDTRPLTCRVDDYYAAHLKPQVDLLDFYRLNAELCNGMQAEVGVPESFRVVVTADHL